MLPWDWNCEFMKTKRQLNFSYCSTSKKHQKTLIFYWIWVIKGVGKDWPALSIRLSSLQNTRHRSHISHFHGFLARSCFQAAVAVPQNRYDLFPWAVSAGTWAWLSVTTSETGRIWGSPVVRDVWYDISMPYITFQSIGLGSRTDSSVTTIMFFAIVRACAGFLPPLLMAAARHGTMDTLEAAGRQLQWIIVQSLGKFLDQTGCIWGPRSEDKDQISMAMDQNHGTLVNIKIAGKWMFIPQSMVL